MELQASRKDVIIVVGLSKKAVNECTVMVFIAETSLRDGQFDAARCVKSSSYV